MLQQTERFQNDVRRYKEAIEKITDESTKSESQKLLNNLILEVKSLDNSFADMIYKKQLNSSNSETRERLASVRKKLDSILKNYLV